MLLLVSPTRVWCWMDHHPPPLGRVAGAFSCGAKCSHHSTGSGELSTRLRSSFIGHPPAKCRASERCVARTPHLVACPEGDHPPSTPNRWRVGHSSHPPPRSPHCHTPPIPRIGLPSERIGFKGGGGNCGPPASIGCRRRVIPFR